MIAARVHNHFGPLAGLWTTGRLLHAISTVSPLGTVGPSTVDNLRKTVHNQFLSKKLHRSSSGLMHMRRSTTTATARFHHSIGSQGLRQAESPPVRLHFPGSGFVMEGWLACDQVA